MILKTRARESSVNLYVAGAQLKRSVDEINRATRERGGKERAEVERAVALNPSRNHHARERLVYRELEVRVLLVVLQ